LALNLPAGIKQSTKITGIFGDPVAHSLSPRMHNYAFEKLELDYTYVPFLVKREDLKSAVDDIRKLNFAGVNVTIPHKEAVLDFMDELQPNANAIGAVNTVVNEGGRLKGYNTDGIGFTTSLRDVNFNPDNKQTAIIWGAGGVARAIAFSLAEVGIKKLILLNRTFERSKKLADRININFPEREMVAMNVTDPGVVSILKNCDIFISTTPVGIEGFPVQPSEFLSSKVFVYDAVYAKTTFLLEEARRAGSKCSGGLGMLIHQGARSFSLWTKLRPPVDLMREALEGSR
jgi:shikimate dehydrogenase